MQAFRVWKRSSQEFGIRQVLNKSERNCVKATEKEEERNNAAHERNADCENDKTRESSYQSCWQVSHLNRRTFFSL